MLLSLFPPTQNADGSFMCTCTEAYTGQTCEEDVNECVDIKPCVNNATCTVSSLHGTHFYRRPWPDICVCMGSAEHRRRLYVLMYDWVQWEKL